MSAIVERLRIPISNAEQTNAERREAAAKIEQLENLLRQRYQHESQCRDEVERLKQRLTEAEAYTLWDVLQDTAWEVERLQAALEIAAARLSQCGHSLGAEEARAAFTGGKQ